MDFVAAAKTFNGGKPVIADDLVDHSRFHIGKWTKEKMEAARPYNNAVPANRTEAVQQLKAFFTKKAAVGSPATQPGATDKP
jgi:hypothetical protein